MRTATLAAGIIVGRARIIACTRVAEAGTLLARMRQIRLKIRRNPGPIDTRDDDMVTSWLTVVVLGFLLILIAANFVIFLYACYEYGMSSKKDPWLQSTQVLAARTGNARSSVIMLHGFGGTPRDFRALAENLAGRGFRVVVPAIPYQTSGSFAYSRGRFAPTAYVDWLRNLIRDEAALSSTPPMLVGMSMGGTLAAIGAADHSVGKLVLISPYFNLAIGDGWIRTLGKWLKWIVPVVPKAAKGQIRDPKGYREYQTGSYVVSLQAFQQLAELGKIAKGKVPNLALPILVFASENDTVASFEVTERLFQGRKQAHMVACNRGNHILTYDFDRERIMMETAAFLTSEISPHDDN